MMDPHQFSFAIRHDNIVAIKKRLTDSGKVEVHILSQDSNYQQFALHASTPLDEIPPNEDTHWKFLMGYGGDLVIVKKGNPGGADPKTHTESKMTEVHILSAQSNYQEWTLHVPTPLPETDDTFDFIMRNEQYNDLSSGPDL